MNDEHAAVALFRACGSQAVVTQARKGRIQALFGLCSVGKT